MDVIHHTYPISAKYVLSRRGFDFNLTTRRLVGELTVEQKSKLDDLITKGEYLIDQL